MDLSVLFCYTLIDIYIKRAIRRSVMKKIWISVILIAAALALGIISWFLLPDVAAVQIGFDGQVTNTMPKLLAIAIPFGISLIGSIMNLTNKEEKNGKGILLAVIGIAAMILILLFNR